MGVVPNLIAPTRVHTRGSVGTSFSPSVMTILETLAARNLFDELPDGVMVMAADGIVEYVNPGAARLLAVSRTEAQGRSMRDLLTILDFSTRAPIAEPLVYLLSRADDAPASRYEIIRRRDGSIMAMDYTLSPLRGTNHAVAGMLLVFRDASRLHARVEQLMEAAAHDEHTHLLRRGELERRLERVLRNMIPGDHHALLFMDLDHFKAVNDGAGHLAGDLALRDVAQLFHAQIRDRDTLARLGGDEFGLLLEHCPLELARERALALRRAVISNPFWASDRCFPLDVSIGIAAIRGGHHNVQDVIGAADSACYAAKRDGENTARIVEAVLN
jgi:diguanylate cyclase (GGDEF)-like protein/PAS domain S-box-containing protein